MIHKIVFSLSILVVIILYANKDMSSPASTPFFKGMTISCQTWGYEWATPEMKQSLDDLQNLGVNSFSIHPYARVYENGRIK